MGRQMQKRSHSNEDEWKVNTMNLKVSALVECPKRCLHRDLPTQLSDFARPKFWSEEIPRKKRKTPKTAISLEAQGAKHQGLWRCHQTIKGLPVTLGYQDIIGRGSLIETNFWYIVPHCDCKNNLIWRSKFLGIILPSKGKHTQPYQPQINLVNMKIPHSVSPSTTEKAWSTLHIHPYSLHESRVHHEMQPVRMAAGQLQLNLTSQNDIEKWARRVCEHTWCTHPKRRRFF